MADNTGSKVSYFLVGLGVGTLLGILFAPKSGEDTREYLRDKAEEGKEYAQRKAREIRERTDELVERGKDAVRHQKDQVNTAIDAGRAAYEREKAKAQ